MKSINRYGLEGESHKSTALEARKLSTRTRLRNSHQLKDERLARLIAEIRNPAYPLTLSKFGHKRRNRSRKNRLKRKRKMIRPLQQLQANNFYSKELTYAIRNFIYNRF